jgi:RNA polymerase sigma factor for flagellar operon FliA
MSPFDNYTDNSSDFTKYEAWLGTIASSVIRRYNLCETRREDFTSAAKIGFVEAIYRFNSKKGDSFEKYAYRRVKGAIIDAVRTESHLSVAGYKKAKDLEEEKPVQNGGLGLLVKQVEYSEENYFNNEITETPETHLEKKQVRALLEEQLSVLTEEERQVIFDYYFNDKSLTEIGVEMAGESRSWASRIHLKALKTLKKLCTNLELR